MIFRRGYTQARCFCCVKAQHSCLLTSDSRKPMQDPEIKNRKCGTIESPANFKLTVCEATRKCKENMKSVQRFCCVENVKWRVRSFPNGLL